MYIPFKAMVWVRTMSNQQPDEHDYETVEIEGVDADTVANRDEDMVMTMHPISELLTPRAKVHIILALHGMRPEKLHMTGICERAGINPSTWYEHHEELLDYGMIEEAGSAGNSTLYRLNMDSEIVQKFSELVGVAAQQKHELLSTERVHENG